VLAEAQGSAPGRDGFRVEPRTASGLLRLRGGRGLRRAGSSRVVDPRYDVGASTMEMEERGRMVSDPHLFLEARWMIDGTAINSATMEIARDLSDALEAGRLAGANPCDVLRITC